MGDLRSFFAAGKTAPIGNTLAGTDSPNGGIRPFRPTRRSALGLFHPDRRLSGSSFFCHARHNLPPARPEKSASSGNPATRNIVRPENPPRPGNPPAQLTFQQSTAGPTLIPPAPVLSGFVPLRSPSPARFTPLSPRRNTCRASPLPPNGMPHEPRRGRPVQICKPDRMPRQKERQPAGAAALRQSDSGPIICC